MSRQPASTESSSASGAAITRELILIETIALLEEKGSIAFRLHDLADRLDVTVSALYYHFRNREALVQAAYVEMFKRGTESNVALASRFAALDLPAEARVELLAERVGLLLDPHAQMMRRSRLKALSTVTDSTDAKDEVVRALQKSQTTVAAAYREAQEKGLIRDDLSPDAIALVLRSFLTGLVLWDLDPSLDVSVEDFSAVISLFLRTLYASPTAN